MSTVKHSESFAISGVSMFHKCPEWEVPLYFLKKYMYMYHCIMAIFRVFIVDLSLKF